MKQTQQVEYASDCNSINLPPVAHDDHPEFLSHVLHLVYLNKCANRVDVVQLLHNLLVISVT